MYSGPSNGGCANDAQPPLFSVIVPVYNAERYVEECLSSVLVQTFGDWELVVVDDGSTDGSLGICERIAASYGERRIRVMSQPNAGQNAARRRGVECATGTLCLFLDSDDFFMDDRALEKLARAWQQTGYDVCLFNAFREKWGTPCIAFPWETGPVPAQVARETLCAVRVGGSRGLNCDMGYIFKAVRRDLFLRTTDSSLPLFEDRLLSYQLFDMAQRFYLVSECLYFYRDTPGSIANQEITRTRLDCQLHVIRATDRYARDWGMSPQAYTDLAVFRRTTLWDYMREAAESREPLQQLTLLRSHEVYDLLNQDHPDISAMRAAVFGLFHHRRFRAVMALFRVKRLLRR